MVLFEVSFGDILVNVPQIRERNNAASGRARERRVGVAGEKLVEAARVQVGKRQSGRLRNLTFDANSALQSIGRVQAGRNLIDGRCEGRGRTAVREVGDRHIDAGEAGWIIDDELLLRNAVQAFGLQDLLGLENDHRKFRCRRE